MAQELALCCGPPLLRVVRESRVPARVSLRGCDGLHRWAGVACRAGLHSDPCEPCQQVLEPALRCVGMLVWQLKHNLWGSKGSVAAHFVYEHDAVPAIVRLLDHHDTTVRYNAP